MAKKVASGGGSSRALLLKAMSLNISLNEMYGVEQSFDELKAQVPEISYVAVTDVRGAILFHRFVAPVGAEEYFREPSVLATLSAPDPSPDAIRVGNQYVVSMPIIASQKPIGMLHIGVSVDFVNKLVLEMLYDILVVLVVALFFTIELLHFLAGSKLEAALKSLGDTIERGAMGDFTATRKPMRELAFNNVLKLLEGVRARVNSAYAELVRDIEAGRRGPAHERPPGLTAAHDGVQILTSRYRFGVADESDRSDESLLAKIRAPLFIFILAEEMTRPFLPGYVKSLLVPIPWISPEIVIGLPIMLFMLIVALAQPFLGAYSERVGNRHAMLVGAGVAAFGYVATALAGTVFDLLVWRSLCALGYAMVFVAAQAHVLEHASTSNRARSFALFVGAIMVATVCGPSIGGILADNIGERLTFGLSALLALGSMAAMQLLPGPRPTDAARAASRAPTLREIGTLLVNKRFMTVTGLAAMPAKILLTGVCFYLVPLYIVSIGSSQSVVGRMLMTYAVVMVVLGPIAAAFATTRERMEWLVGSGLLISGLGGALLLAGSGNAWVFAAVFLIGLGQSLSIAAQSALVREHSAAEVAAMGEPAVYGVYRLLERLGNAIGPMLAGVLVLLFGYRTSFIVTGGIVLLCGIGFLLATRREPTPALVTA
jgi:MFS family permease